MGSTVVLDAVQSPRLLLMPGTQGSGTNCSPPAYRALLEHLP